MLTNITQTVFEGLNYLQTDPNITSSESTLLVNMDTSPSGGLTTRKGTRIVYKEQTQFRVSLHELSTRLGYKFLISKNGTTLRVMKYDELNDIFNLLLTFTSVFTNSEELTYAVNLPDLYSRLLLLSQSTVPITLSVLEYRQQLSGLSFSFQDERWSVHASTALVFVDGALEVSAIVSYALGTVTVTLAAGVASSTVDVLMFTWQWWAESRTWFGENFFYGVPRFGETIVDQHIAVPPVILSDSETEQAITAMSVVYKTNEFNEFYTYVPTNQPIAVDEYSWSDGANWIYDGSLKTITPSPQFITFGRESNPGLTSLTDDDVNYADSTFNVPFHPYRTYDVVRFTADSGLVFDGIVPGQPYYVRVIDDDNFELYSDVNLNNKVTLSPRASVTFTDINVNYEANIITILNHNLTNSDIVRASSTGVLVQGMDSLQPYYVEVIDANRIRLFIDRNKTQPVVIFPRSLRTVEATDYDQSALAVNSLAHALYEITPVRFDVMYGTLPAGITGFTVYYADPVTDELFALYTDPALTNRVNDFTGAVGTTGWFIDGGLHTLTIFSGTVVAGREKFDNVFFSRRRQVPFNGGKGILPANLAVTVNNQPVVRSTVLTANPSPKSYYTYTTALGTPVINDGLVQFIAFESSENVGLERADIVRLTNIERRWVGSSAVAIESNSNGFRNGGYTPIYGLDLWCDYDQGIFPTLGIVFQGRLVLSGFNNKQLLLLWSATSDSVYRDEFFRYFQITDNLTGLATDPFDLIIGADTADKVTALVVFQSSLFAFTGSSAWRTFSPSVEVTSSNRAVGRVSNQGCLNPNCVIATESSIFYLSPAGVFDLSLSIAESNYIAGEISTKIRPVFELFDQASWSIPWMVYDPDELKVYLAIPVRNDELNNRIYVYDTVSKGWSEYIGPYIYFETYGALVMYDKRSLVLFAGRGVCNNIIARFKYHLYIDFAEDFLVETLPVDGLPLIQQVITDVVANREYELEIWTTGFINFNDLVVVAGATDQVLLPLTLDSDFIKTYDNKIVFFDSYAIVVIRENALL